MIPMEKSRINYFIYFQKVKSQKTLIFQTNINLKLQLWFFHINTQFVYHSEQAAMATFICYMSASLLRGA